jgi:hypothetical protein
MRCCRIPTLEREKYRWHRFRTLKQSMFMLNGSILWENFILGVFFYLESLRKTYLSLVWFLISGWFWLLRRFFEAIDKFIVVPKGFWVKNGLKYKFWGQTNLSLDFIVTTVVMIWANQTTYHLICFSKNFRAGDMSSVPIATRKI